MSSTHSSLLYHLVFGTKHQQPMIDLAWRDRLHAWLGGLVRAAGGIPLEVGGVADHVHLLVSLKPTHQLSELLRDIKRKSSEWVHQEIGSQHFEWQEGYGAFTVGSPQQETVRQYIRRQEEHHRTRAFREEYLHFLQKSGIQFDERYLW